MIDLVNSLECPNCSHILSLVKYERWCYPKHRAKRKYNLTRTPIWYVCNNCNASYIPLTLQRVEITTDTPDKILLRKDLGDLFTLEKFIEYCEEGNFINYDGSGYYSDGIYEYRNKMALPSDITRGLINRDFTHVIWYNK